jgi:hypothetical protein
MHFNLQQCSAGERVCLALCSRARARRVMPGVRRIHAHVRPAAAWLQVALGDGMLWGVA